MNEIERKYKEKFLGQIDDNLSECDDLLQKISAQESDAATETLNVFRETICDLRSLLNQSLRTQKLSWTMRLPELEQECRRLKTRLEVELRLGGQQYKQSL